MRMILLLGMMLVAAGESPVSIPLAEEVSVDTRYVRLTDLVRRDSVDAVELAPLTHVWLGRAPEGEESRVITREEILRELDRREINATRFAFSGESVKVRRVKEGDTAGEGSIKDRIRTRLHRAVRELRGEDDGKISVRISYLSVPEFPEGARLLTVVPRENLRIGSVSFVARVAWDETAEAEIREVDGIARIHRVVRVAFARRRLLRHQVIRHEDIAMKEVELRSTEGYLMEASLLAGSKMRVEVGAGDVLRPDQIEMRPVIRRGETVTVSHGAVSNRGKALDDGRPGGFVRVEFGEREKGNLSIVSCRVTGRGTAELVRKEQM